MKPTLIGVIGRKQHGKNSVGRALALAGYVEDSFAAPLKAAVKVALGMSEDQVDGDLKETVDDRYGITPRHAMQTLGTEWGRDRICDDVWIRAAMDRHRVRREVAEGNPDDWVLCNGTAFAGTILTDVRFHNEAAAIRDAGGVVIYVVRPGLDTDDNHASERDIEDIAAEFGTYIVRNDGDLEMLYAKVAELPFGGPR